MVFNALLRMSKTTIAVLVVVGVLGFFIVSYIGSVFSFRQDCVNAEAGIVAQYDQNRNNYDNMWKRFKEMAQVPDAYAGKLKELFTDTVQARYGAEGSKAMFQFIQEQNPNLDASVYTKLQTAIEAGRTSFAADQKQLIDKKAQYEMLIKSNRALFVNWVLGYPKIDLSKYDIVTSATTEKAFETKQADEVRVFGN